MLLVTQNALVLANAGLEWMLSLEILDKNGRPDLRWGYKRRATTPCSSMQKGGQFYFSIAVEAGIWEFNLML